MNKNAYGMGLILLVICVAAGCSSGPSGDYGGDDCGLYDKLTFRDNGKVYISMKMFGMQVGETAGDFVTDDDKIIVTANNQTTVFTLNDDGDLESSMLGDKIVCRKGAGGGSASGSSSEPATSLSASYGGVACMLDKLSFKDDGNVDLYVDDERRSGTYRMKGDQVSVMIEGNTIDFTLSGDSLGATIEGQKTVCSKL